MSGSRPSLFFSLTSFWTTSGYRPQAQDGEAGEAERDADEVCEEREVPGHVFLRTPHAAPTRHFALLKKGGGPHPRLLGGPLSI